MMPANQIPEDASKRTDEQELFLMRLRYKEGRLIEVGANTPFLLNDSDLAWVVYAGKVDIFAVQVQDGQPAGPRHHLLRAQVGQALFGMDMENLPRGFGLLAVGTVGAQLIRVKRSRLQDLARNPLQTEAITNLLNEWVAGLAQAMVDTVPPKECRLLELGQEIDLPENASVRSHKGVAWVRHVKGCSTFMGCRELTPLSSDGYFPLSGNAWLEAAEAATLSSMDTAQFMAQDPAWSDLNRFHALMLDAVGWQRQQAAQMEREALRRKIETDQLALERSVSRLASVMETGRTHAALEEEGDPLLAVCRLVGQAQGITIRPHPDMKKGRKLRDPLSDIAKASRIRIRQVLLRGEWWRNDSGPLVAFLDSDERPVALLPISPRQYELHDPVEQTRTVVTAEMAAKLSPAAYTFYRPFGDGAVTVPAMFKFGLLHSQGDLGMMALMGLGIGLLGIATPIASGILVDTIIPNAARSQLVQIALALVAAAIAETLFEITRAIAQLRLESKMDASVQAALWDRLLNLPAPFFRHYTAGDLTSRALGIASVRQILTGAATSSILSSVFSIFSLALLFYFQWQLALVAVGVVLIIVAISSWASLVQLRMQRAVMNQEGFISGLVLQLVTGISKLLVANAEGRAFALWAKEFTVQKQLAWRNRSIANRLAVFNSVASVAATMTIFAMIAFTLEKSSFSTGAFVAFNAAFMQFLTAMLSMNSTVISVLRVVPIYERLKPILDTPPEVDAVKTDPGDLTGDIEVSHLSFRYSPDGPQILRDVSLHARPGEFVAVVGPSGSGKSTLFRLLLGFEKPETGAVYYDGQDLSKLDIQAVRHQIGAVLQSGKLMSGDIYRNIVGSSRLTMDDAWEAARMAGLDEDIKQMPMGMQTVVMEGGSTFSGGQRQRLMIARAIVTKPRIILFDEATSALDNETQEKISRSLESLQATRFVIAHRLSTIVKADHIYVIVAGQVVQSGTYGELLNQRGPFADLVKRQLA